MRKKIIIAAGIAALVLIAVLCVILFASPGRGKAVENFDTDSSYEYSFTASRRGLNVTISGGKDGFAWTAKSLQPIVTAGDAIIDGEKTSFLLSPAGDGTGRVEFTLCDQNDPSKRAYQLYADLRVSGQDVTVVSSGHQEFVEDFTDEEGHFTVTMQEKNLYLVCMSPAIDAKWSVSTEGSSVLVEENSVWDDLEPVDTKKAAEKTYSLTMSTYFTIKCIGSEPTTVYIYDRNHPTALEIKMDYDEQNGLYPTACAMVSYKSDHISKPVAADGDPYSAHVMPEEEPEGETADETGEAKPGSEEQE